MGAATGRARACGVVLAMLALGAAARYLRRSLLTVAVEGRSMWPALAPGDWLIVRRGGVPRDGSVVGRVVCVRAPDGRMLVKRIAAGPGDASPRDGAPLPPDAYFVLGDSLEASTDSRHFGAVSATAIEGIAWLRYWPARRTGRIAHAPAAPGS